MAPSRAVTAKKEELYEFCAGHASGTTFFQDDLLRSGVARTGEELQEICQALINEHLFEVHQWEGTVCYKVRTRDDAKKIDLLPGDERLIFNQIRSTDTTGMWTRTIKAKTNLHQTVITKCLKNLEGKRLIKAIRSVKYPSRKIYMLANLVPAEEVTGGPWFADGELDVDLVDELSDVICKYVGKLSWAESRGPTPAEIRRKKDAVLAAQAQGIVHDEPRHRPKLISGRVPVPRPPDYQGYPTVSSILEFLETAQIAQVDLTEADLKNLLDMLVFDGRLEQMSGAGYRTVRELDEEPSGPGNGLSQAPCGRCPVFALCEEGGPVNASTCEYFEEWLKS